MTQKCPIQDGLNLADSPACCPLHVTNSDSARFLRASRRARCCMLHILAGTGNKNKRLPCARNLLR